MHPSDRLPLQQERARYQLHRNDPGDHRYRDFLNRLAEPLVLMLPPHAEGLDYGSGPGPTLSVMLRERGFPTREYDPCFAADPKALACSYDFVTCSETAEHFHRPAEEFDRLDRLLRPGGFLAMMTEWMDDDDECFENWWYVRDPTHVCFYSPQTLRWIARQRAWTLHLPRQNVALWQTATTPT